MTRKKDRNYSRLPAYLRVARMLRERIEQHAYRHEEFLPSERELAQELAVSRQTVRLAIETLRTDGLVLPEQGRGNRILRAELHETAVVASDQFQLIALIIYGLSREGSAGIVQGCQAAVSEEGFHLILCETARDIKHRAENEASHLRTLIDKGIQGILLYTEPTDRNRSLLEEALERGVHLVQVDRFLPDLDCDYVGVDNVAAAQRMTEHLLALGKKRIAFLSTRPEPSSCRERVTGYRLALSNSNESERPIVAHCNGTEEDPACVVRRWLSLPEPPDAIFAANDSLALIVMQTLRESGVRVPEDISVVGFDDHYAAAHVFPSLTTVHQPFDALGETAAQLLVDRMTGRYRGAPRRVMLPTQIVVRRSCGGSGHKDTPVRPILSQEVAA